MTRVVYFACVCACACACWTGNHMEVLSHSHDRAWTMAGSGDQWRYSANKLLQVQFHASVSRRFSPFTREFWPRTPRWNGLNETLFIYLFSGCRHWPTRTFWVHDDLGMKTWPESHFEKRLVLFLLLKTKQNKKNDWTGFAIMLQDSAGGFILFCSFLFCYSPHLLLLPREILPSVQEDQGQ